MKYTQGQSVQKIVEGGDSLWIYTDDTATVVVTPDNVSANAVTTTVDRTDGTVKYGPYYKPTVVNVTATSLDADVRNYEFIANPTTEGEFGEVMAATGGMTPGEIGSAIRTSSRSQNMVTAFGNSITAATVNFAERFTSASNGKYLFLFNAGVGGDDIQDMLTRTDEIPEGTMSCTVMESSNSASSGITPVQYKDALEQIFKILISRQIAIKFILSVPKDSPSQISTMNDYNVYAYLLCRKYRIECYSIWDDYFDFSDGSWGAGFSYDGIHPASTIQIEAGDKLALNDLSSSYSIPYAMSDATSGVSGYFSVDSNTDGLADNWTSSGSPVTTLTADRGGNVQSISGTGGFMYIASANYACSEGDKIIICSDFYSTVSSGSPFIKLYAQFDTSNRFYLINELNTSITTTPLYTEMTVPNGFSNFKIYLTMTGTYSAECGISRVSVINLSDYVV